MIIMVIIFIIINNDNNIDNNNDNIDYNDNDDKFPLPNSENYHFVNHLCAYLRYNNIPELFTFLSRVTLI